MAIFVNFALNWGIAWGVFRSLAVVPREGELGINGDTVATCWMLPLISCLIVTALTRNEMRQGRIPGMTVWSAAMGRWQPLTQNIWLRAIGWGLIGRYLLAPIALQGLDAAGLGSLTFSRFLLFKALFAVGLGLFFCPYHAWYALHDDVWGSGQGRGDVVRGMRSGNQR